MMKLLLY